MVLKNYKYLKLLFLNTLRYNHLPTKTKTKKNKFFYFSTKLDRIYLFIFFFFKLEHSQW